MSGHFEVKMLTEEGISRFGETIDELQQNSSAEIDLSWIHDGHWSRSVEGPQPIEKMRLDLKLDGARYLLPVVQSAEIENKYFHQGLWAWLSAFFFDSVCPRNTVGERIPGKAYRHIPPSDRYWRTVYRHLLAGPARLYEMHGEDIGFLLKGKINEHGDFMEQLASRQEIAASRGILEGAGMLYFDQSTGQAKPGARSKDRRPGTLRRYVDVLQQLMLTYDLYSMTASQILGLLPIEEFGSWLPEEITAILEDGN